MAILLTVSSELFVYHSSVYNRQLVSPSSLFIDFVLYDPTIDRFYCFDSLQEIIFFLPVTEASGLRTCQYVSLHLRHRSRRLLPWLQ